MENKIEDYLHLYLPIAVELNNGGSKVYNRVAVAVGNTDDEFRYVTLRLGKGKKSFTHSILLAEPDRIKPILRPLIDMTEEEMKDVLIMHFHESGRDVAAQSIVSVKKKHEVKMASKYGTGIPYIVYNESNIPHSDDVLSFSELNADQFIYLLSRGFDLFGLIEAGLAIDKTTLPTTVK